MSDTKKTLAKAPAKKPDPVMYVGPTINGLATCGTVYTSIPEAAKTAQAKAPLFLNLFIPVTEYGTADQMIRNHKGYIFEAYKDAEKNLKK